VFLPWAPIQQADDNSTIAEIASRRGITTTQVVLAWLIARSPSILPIPGTGSVQHLEENVAAAGIHLDPHEVADLNASLS
jgi:aryl-alcohol dehydrogenase-like predicted oxidoreductase